MTKIQKDIQDRPSTFKAIANVNFHLPVAMFDDIKKYNEKYIKQVNSINGTDSPIPAHMNLRSIFRGDIMLFGEEICVNAETGNVEIYPISIYEELNKMNVSLPCAMMGEVDANFDKSLAALPVSMRKQLDDKRESVTAKYRVVPFIEKYTGQELED